MSNHIYIVQNIHLVLFITDSLKKVLRVILYGLALRKYLLDITDLGLLNDRVSLCDSLRLCTLPSFKLSTIFSFISSCQFSTAPFDNFDSIMMKCCCCCCPSAPFLITAEWLQNRKQYLYYLLNTLKR